MAMNAEPAGGTSTKMAKNAKKKGKKGGSRRQEDAAGAGGPTAGEVVRDAVVRQLGDLQQADLMVRTGQPDGVHQVRVACRRLRSTMAAFRPVWDRERTDPLREELRWLGGELSGPRDTEVALEHLRELVAAQPVELVLGPVAARLQQTEAAGHEQGERQAQRALGERRYLALLDALDALVADPPVTGRAAEPAVPVLREVLRATAKRLRRRVRDVEAATAPEERSHALHEVRKAGKRVRYTAEVAAGQLGDDVAALVDVLKTLQDELGARQDTVVTRELCRTVGLAAFGAGENAWTYGRLHGLEEARAERAERSFDALWPQVRRAVKAATMTR
jgi:CHAD domain-containing protein